MENRFYFNQKDAITGDYMPFYDKRTGAFHLFYIFLNTWHHISTRDFIDFSYHGVALPAGTVHEPDSDVYSGCVLEKDGLYYIYYTGHNHHEAERNSPYTEVILRATSTDLYTWVKDKNFVIAPREGFNPNAWRDPHILYDQAKKKYYMFFTGSKNEKMWKRWGCTVMYVSDNMLDWAYDGIAYGPDLHDTHECPDVFKIGEWYYLVYSTYNRQWETRYRMAKSVKGPWIRPKDDMFDGRAYYAAKTASDEHARYLFGWACIRQDLDDKKPYVWGGSLVPHKILQRSDGTLYCAIPQTISNAFSQEEKLSFTPVCGTAEKSEEKYVLGGEKFSYAKLMEEDFSKDYCIKGSIKLDGCASGGIIIRGDDSLENYYIIQFDALQNRFYIVKSCDFFESHSFDESRNVSFNGNDKTFDFEIILSGSMMVIYCNDAVLSARAHNLKKGYFGLFAEEGMAQFSNIKIFSRNEK